MAEWCPIRIVLDPPVPAGELEKLRDVLSSLDSDFPTIEASGYEGFWRSPAIGIQETLDVLAWLGYPCRGDTRSGYSDDRSLPEAILVGVPRPLSDEYSHVATDIAAEAVRTGLCKVNKRAAMAVVDWLIGIHI
jgi:hypothetical protein